MRGAIAERLCPNLYRTVRAPDLLARSLEGGAEGSTSTGFRQFGMTERFTKAVPCQRRLLYTRKYRRYGSPVVPFLHCESGRPGSSGDFDLVPEAPTT
jgi:hypothetical protein